MGHHKNLTGSQWEERLIACEPRLSEIVEMYKEIGLDVRLEPLPPKDRPGGQDEKCSENGCTACFDEDRDRYRVIFTRPREQSEEK